MTFAGPGSGKWGLGGRGWQCTGSFRESFLEEVAIELDLEECAELHWEVRGKGVAGVAAPRQGEAWLASERGSSRSSWGWSRR